ncbi:MAG: DUF2905 domain-containing protein [Gammaproteobacteria bacterium]|nr:DUF2905 domain-containing protein [Gammaproteobacteria bacterium]
MARWLIFTGTILIAVGLVLRYAPWLLDWFGRLPGDIRIDTEKAKIRFPIVSMLVVSLVITVLANLMKK